MKPLLLLDVDGVIIPFGYDEIPENYGIVFDSSNGDDWLVMSSNHGGYLKELRQHFTLVWSTMWEDQANLVLTEHLDIHHLPVIEFSSMMHRHSYREAKYQTFKLPAIEQYVADKPFAWIDDDIYVDGTDWAAKRDLEIPTLFIKTNPKIGFSQGHFEQLLDFGKRCGTMADGDALDWRGRPVNG